MSGIFGKPEQVQQENKYGLKVLFLHGLEGRGPNGTKARILSGEWGSLCPSLRCNELQSLRDSCSGQWSILNQEDIDEAFEVPYNDARDAVRYAKPDVIVGSSMGGAILFKLIAEGFFEGAAVFCAPAIGNLLSRDFIERSVKECDQKFFKSTWLLGETDTVVSNRHNLNVGRRVGGNIIFSPGDGHRLTKAAESGILNSAVLTSIEIYNS